MNSDYNKIIENLKWQLCQYDDLLLEKDSFIAEAFHEVRNPLNGALHTLDSLRETTLSDEQHSLVEQLSSCFLLMNTILSGVLTLAKSEKENIDYPAENFNLLSALKTVEGMFTHELEIKGLHWQTEYTFAETLSICFYKQLLLQVLINLLSNACKFTDTGYVKLSVKEVTSPVGNAHTIALRFSVTDTGCGLDNTAEPWLKGNGIGLNLCKEILAQLHSALEIAPSEEGGTIFSFQLDCPLSQDFSNDLHNHRSSTSAQAAISTACATEKQVLFIDDTPLNREIAVSLLNGMGISCDAAPNGKSAIQLCLNLPKNYYDLIVIDANLPVINGFSTAKIIAYYLKETCPLVLTSGFSQEMLQSSLDKSPFTAFLAKPFTAANFYHVIGNCLGISPLESRSSAFQSTLDHHKVKFLQDYKESDRVFNNLFFQNKFDELALYAHSIKGLAATLQFSGVAQAAGVLEARAAGVLEVWSNEGIEQLRPAIESYSRALHIIFSKNFSNLQSD